MTTSSKIQDMLKVAAALGAPTFSLDKLLAGAIAVEQQRSAMMGDTIVSMFEADTTALDNDLLIIERGAQQAFSWIVGNGLLPPELDAMIDRDGDATKPLGVAFRVALKYV